VHSGLVSYSSIATGGDLRYGALDVPELSPWWKRPRRSGERPRILIIGPQRSETEFRQAGRALAERGYQGTFVRLSTIAFTGEGGCELTGHPTVEEPVPPEVWKREVRSRMRHCDGVAQLGDSSAVHWERRVARTLRKPVHPLGYWLRA
jgi:hypothetical protein